MEEIEAALSLKLCEYVIWPPDSNRVFTIGVLSDNKDIYQAFRKLSARYKINDRRVEVQRINVISDLSVLQMLFVGEDNLAMVSQTKSKFLSSKVMLITEKDKDTKEIMFNLLPLPDEDRVSFEFNKANIIFEGFDIRPEIIELRGSEIDVRDLYRQTRTRLEMVETQIDGLQNKINEQNINITRQGKAIDSLNKSIIAKNEIIQLQTDSIDEKEKVLAVLANKTLMQEQEIQKNRWTINKQQENITAFNQTIKGQDEKIAQQIENLGRLNVRIGQKQNEIIQKEVILSEKDTRIKFRTNLIYFFVALLFLVAVLAVLLFNAFRKNREGKLVLSRQKEELEATLNKLTQAQEQLVRSEKMVSLGVLTAGIAHEINNPVNFINSGSLGLQKILRSLIPLFQKYREHYVSAGPTNDIAEMEKELDIPHLLESTDTMMKSIKTGIDRTVSIIKSLQSFARSDGESAKAINIHDNIDLALTILHNQYKYSIDIIRNYGTLPEVYCYSGKMNQVFMNLLSNAIQAIPEKGIITITTRDISPDIEISIKDTGIGIPREIIGKVFDPFFTTKDEGKGTGMGLSIVYSIIEEHNGKIVVESQEGKGTEFIITLPCRQEK